MPAFARTVDDIAVVAISTPSPMTRTKKRKPGGGAAAAALAARERDLLARERAVAAREAAVGIQPAPASSQVKDEQVKDEDAIEVVDVDSLDVVGERRRRRRSPYSRLKTTRKKTMTTPCSMRKRTTPG